MTTAAYETERPKEKDGCKGTIRFFEDSSESYTAHGLSVWTEHFLVMDGASCSDGHSFDEDQIKQMEKNANEASRDDSWRY